MATSAARILANQQNALLSTGPKTVEGKERSRANSYQHGLTGAGVVVPVEEAAEVERRASSFAAELRASGELGLALVRRAAILSVRMEKCAERDLSATAERMARAMAEFEAPEGIDEAEAMRRRVEAGRIAAFDPSKEACQFRRYEAAAERGFYRALKELRQLEKQGAGQQPADVGESLDEVLGSFSEIKKLLAEPLPMPAMNPRKPAESVAQSPFAMPIGRVDVPITIGRAR